jgi:RNA polymerase sigma-70 factor (sigma-E family)
MRGAEEDGYREYVGSRLEPLRRTAFLLCRDWYLADDLVSITFGKLYRHWRRASAADNLDAYVHGMLTHAWLDERRRPWRREATVPELPESVEPAAEPPDNAELLRLLGTLPPRRRAVIILRFFCDFSVAQTAEQLGISEGAVKSQAARGLAALRLSALVEPVRQETP